jgi:hypothetical protein
MRFVFWKEKKRKNMRKRASFFCVCILSLSFSFSVRAESFLPEMVVLETNLARLREGLPFLVATTSLARIAHTKADDMRVRGYFAHESPSGERVADLAEKSGYPYLRIGENLALGQFSSARELVDAWLASPGHRKNILSPTFSELGVGLVPSVVKGVPVLLAVQTFGLPRSVCPQVNKEQGEKIQTDDELLVILQLILNSYDEHAVPLKLVRYYNDKLVSHRAEVDAYNKGVRVHNACIEKFL